MRATHRSDRVRIWPKLAVASALTLLASSMVAGVVFAATPTVAWGTFTPDTVTTGAQPALVSAGRIASFTVSLRNDDASTISQLYLKAVTQAAQPAPEVTGLYFVSTTRSTCAQPSARQTTLSCSFRNVKPGDLITIQVGYTVPLGAAATCLEGRAKNFGTPLNDDGTPNTIAGANMFCVDFVWSTTGATTSDQNNTSHGDVWNFYDGVATTDSADVGSTYVFDSKQFSVGNGPISATNGQSTKIEVNQTLQGVTTSDGLPVESIDCSTSTLSATDCAAFNKYKFAEWSELTVGTTGTQPTGAAFAVTMSINPAVYPLPSGVNKNNLAVYHTYQTPTGGTVEEIIRTACAGSAPALPCISSLTVSKTLIQVTFLTGHNGKGGMY
jgi:hypothetical protein